jgi:hypothetical protein
MKEEDKVTEKNRHPSRRRKITMAGMAIFLMLAICAPLWASGQVARIEDILLTRQGDKLLVYGRLTDCFTSDMESAIMAGVPTTFTFMADLYQEKSDWFDKKITSTVVRHTIKYDSIRKIFYVFSSLDRDPAIFQDLEKAKQAMAEFNGILSPPLRELRKDLPHYVMLKAKLDKVRLPLYMEYVLFFVSLWDFETDWYRRPVNF